MQHNSIVFIRLLRMTRRAFPWTKNVLVKYPKQQWFGLWTLDIKVALKCNTKSAIKQSPWLFLGRTKVFSKGSLVALPLWVDESQKPLVIGEYSHVRVDEEDCVEAADRQNAVENSLWWANDDWWQRRPFSLTAEEWMSHSSEDDSENVSLLQSIGPLKKKKKKTDLNVAYGLWNPGSVYPRTPISEFPFLHLNIVVKTLSYTSLTDQMNVTLVISAPFTSIHSGDAEQHSKAAARGIVGGRWHQIAASLCGRLLFEISTSLFNSHSWFPV